jgi:hypothetical protein
VRIRLFLLTGGNHCPISATPIGSTARALVSPVSIGSPTGRIEGLLNAMQQPSETLRPTTLRGIEEMLISRCGHGDVKVDEQAVIFHGTGIVGKISVQLAGGDAALGDFIVKALKQC